MMTEISELDLQNLRHLIGGYSTTHCKMTTYADQATDPSVKTVLPEICTVRNGNKTAAHEIFTVGGDEHG